MNHALREAFTRLKAKAVDELVCVNCRDDRLGDAAFAKAREKAGLFDVTLHTTRDTFASRLARAGVGDRTVQELGGLRTSSIVERYAHLGERHKAEAVERIVRNQASSPDAIHDAGSGDQRTTTVSS